MDALLPRDDDCFFGNLILTPVILVEVVAFRLAWTSGADALGSRPLRTVVQPRYLA